jgi:hypothetical protein
MHARSQPIATAAAHHAAFFGKHLKIVNLSREFLLKASNRLVHRTISPLSQTLYSQ